ncbi:MAG: metal ABC transporter substrate-binding protein, partial [Eggerthellaceae bacterium]|nr:metal ABC transporter substrate-binding protein [Eggerthellaceae bacterium]
MKKITLVVTLVLTFALASILAGCAGKTAENTQNNAEDTVIRVGATPVPHAEILEAISDELAAEGYTLEIVEYQDYIQPNVAVSEGDLDANYFQHQPYLDDYNAENGTDLASVAKIHFEPLALYKGKSASIENIKKADKPKVAVPSDATNEARALLLLESAGLIKLPQNADLTVTPNDIVENPYNIEFVEAAAEAVARNLQDVEAAVINGNYALEAGLTANDVLASEDASSAAALEFGNIVCVAAGNENTEKTKALVKALT